MWKSGRAGKLWILNRCTHKDVGVRVTENFTVKGRMVSAGERLYVKGWLTKSGTEYIVFEVHSWADSWRSSKIEIPTTEAGQTKLEKISYMGVYIPS